MKDAITSSAWTPRVIHSRKIVDEGVWRYTLPFGVLGKHKSFVTDLTGQKPTQRPIVVIQDIRIRCPAEYIFGLTLGDCSVVNIHLDHLHDSLLASLEHLMDVSQPSLVILAVPWLDTLLGPVFITLEKLYNEVPTLKKRVRSGHLALEGWMVDESRRRCKKVWPTGEAPPASLCE